MKKFLAWLTRPGQVAEFYCKHLGWHFMNENNECIACRQSAIELRLGRFKPCSLRK